jgi:hypothetical protein
MGLWTRRTYNKIAGLDKGVITRIMIDGYKFGTLAEAIERGIDVIENDDVTPRERLIHAEHYLQDVSEVEKVMRAFIEKGPYKGVFLARTSLDAVQRGVKRLRELVGSLEY